VVGIFPSPKSTVRLIGALLLEQDEEWSIAERRYFSVESMKQLAAPALPPTAQEILASIA
jgi:putative transposase